ncbi:hypothetical protein ONS95_010590 [Cadophora gregata]|uniref:uncharacterized protein n=1 Tax=Cadophora gregata TaxID=51156 RepID=UPI0026DCA92E|nr:uncharacterized protein ONS95_010590 [Cadophora gregata]KAK0122349.1 hypothetical protein ONS95_010590 [Cadophora gregata]KAK0127826.1 hypothetical protein ONS96_007329 [Cadophora gregata f. sp. sojae]
MLRATVVWLGEEGEHTRTAFSLCNILKSDVPEHLSSAEMAESHFAKRIKELSTKHPEKLKILEGWESLAALIALPCWARTWIIQEVAISCSATLLWVSQKMDIETLKLSLETLRKYSPTIWHYFEGLEHITGLLLLRTSVDDHDGSSTIPDPNYEEPVDSLVRAITIKKLTTVCPEQVVDIICLDHGRVPRREDLPSWVVDWISLWEQPDGNILSSRLTRFLSSSDFTKYEACGRSRVTVQISRDQRTLTCYGYHFDIIRGLSLFDSRVGFVEAAPHSLSTLTSFENQLWRQQNVYGSELELLKAIWLSSIHNPVIDGTGMTTSSSVQSFQNLFSDKVQKPAWVESTWMDIIKEAGEFKLYGRKLNDWFAASRDLSCLETMNILKSTEYIDPADRENSFWDSIQIGRFGRRMMETAMGYVGTAHAQAHVGDSVVLLQGASVPIILRPCDGGYRVIGEAYVYGIMQGEFCKTQHESEMKAFHLK